MKKLLKVLHCICLSGAILFGAVNKADAFFLMPPMPWDLEIDLPANAGKIVSEAKALILQAKTIKSQLNTKTLTSLSGSLKLIGDIKKDKSTQKNPGKGVVSGNVGGTELSETKSEKDYFDAYYKLFYIYPAASNYQADKEKGEEGYQLLHAAYKNKAVEYRQDVTVDTYITGLLTERYLVLVEKTLKRLEKCQNNINLNGEEGECTFFGLRMEKIESVENPNDVKGEDNTGLMAQTKNAYIVSTVYDRLMRIVEDLTATEAIYEAAKQIDLVEPESDGEKESSAEKYLPQKYHFVSKDIEEKAYAKSILSQKTKSSCFEGGGKNCPGYNKEAAALDNMEDAQILHEIAEIKENLNKARDYHNLKVQMPKYKTKYRQYLIADIIHKRVYESLEKSEECAKTFFEEHKNNAFSVWGNPGKSNEHEKREKNSISRMLIEKYQSETTNKIIGGDMDCDGYYENCPIGYKQNTEEHCVVLGEKGEVIREEFNLHPCIVETVTKATDDTDDEENTENQPTELEQLDANRTDTADVIPDDDKEVPYDDSDFLKDATQADELQNGGRIANETSWQIGREILEQLVENKDIKFERAWNDQKSFQEQYLRQKYRNIGLIIKSIDTAVNSYKLAQSAANKEGAYNNDNDDVTDKLTQVMNAIASCESMDKAKERAHDEFCNNSTEEDCKIVANKETGIITGKKIIIDYDSKGNEVQRTETKTWNQKASMKVDRTCAFKKEKKANVNVNIADSNNDSCSSNWDLSVGYLVRSYYNDYLGQCAAEKSEAMRAEANDKGRIVAQDKLYEVITKRIDEDARIEKIIKDHEEKINSLKKLMNGDNGYKHQMNQYNKKIDAAAQQKNKAHQALKMSKQRVQSIDDEIKQIVSKQRVQSIEDENKQGVQSIEDEIEQIKNSSCATGYDIAKLEYEKAQIENGKATWACPSSCNELEKSKRDAIGCDDKKAPESHLIGIAEFNEDNKDNDSKFVAIGEAEGEIRLQSEIIKASEEQRNFIKEEIARLEKEIRDLTDEFADKYVDEAERSQEAIEAANDTFEAFMENDYRMENKNVKKCVKHVAIIGCTKHANTTYEEDDLATTITKVFKNTDEPLKEVVKQTINGFANDMSGITDILQNLELPAQFVLDDTFDAIGVGAGYYNAAKFAKKVKEMIVDIAAEKVANGVTNADEKVNTAREDAIAALQETIGKKGINVCEECILSDIGRDEITSQVGYAKIKQAHINMIEKFREIEENAGIDELFGIPYKEYEDEGKVVVVDEGKVEDGEYFVALPARGADYLGKQDYEKESLDGKEDSGAGRDYRAPRAPFLHQPPVREVFYYSAQDYEDTPKSKKKKKQLYAPAIPYLLNKKYPDSSKTWEYMPEVWRYLLARPNLRKDRKYQQTFVERSLDMNVLRNILNNENYQTIIARGGTYPCKIGAQHYDMIGHDTDIKKIKFIYRNTIPSGIKTLQQCYDINLFNQRPCNTYEIHRSSICHLLSNHGRKENSSKNNKKYYEDYQKMSTADKKEQKMFADYSELGMLLQFEGNRLVYRKAQQYLNENLLSENYTENNIHRQKAEHASFKHNIFGSFLDNVNAEFNARKNLEKITEDVKSSLENICEVIHNQKEPVKDENGKIIGETRRIIAGEKITDNCDEACLNKQCAEILFGNFADSAEDKAYGVKGEYNDDSYAGVNCGPTAEYAKKNMYQSIFCQLDSWKKESLGAATTAFNNLMKNSKSDDRIKVSNELIDIMKEIAALNADDDEVTVVTANMDVDIQLTDMTKIDDNVYSDITGTVEDYMKDIIKTAKTDRTIERENDDLGIASMENQNQIIPYCPFYVYKDNYGL